MCEKRLIFLYISVSCFSPRNIGTLFRCCVLGESTLPSHASLDSGVNEYTDRPEMAMYAISF